VRRLLRVTAIVGGVLVLLLGVVTAAGVFGVRRSLPDVEGRISMPGLATPVEVRRDSYGIPQLYADTAEDLFRAQGYVHAQDRFYEMDFRRHVTSGRLSEWFGEDQLKTDIFLRTLGWRRVAEQEFPKLLPTTRLYLTAYAEGVNAYLAGHSGGELSVEYTGGLLGPEAKPEPWTPVDSLAWLKAMAWDLRGNLDNEIDRVIASTKVSTDQVADLYPAYPFSEHAPIVTTPVPIAPPTVAPAPQAPGRAALPEGVDSALRSLRSSMADLPAQLGASDRSGIGSNSWVVSGSKTTTGKPLLANDPHLAPAMPSIWYQMGLHCRKKVPDCPFDVAGFTFSGVPGVMIGHNDRVAWGFTNLDPDVTDLFVERLSGDSYLYDDRWYPLASRTENIRVKGRPDPVRITVRATRHGPLVSDADAELRRVSQVAPASGQDPMADVTPALALRWTALIPGRTADAIFLLNQARDFGEFRKAAEAFEVPSQNLVYADVDGHIGYQAPGRVPVRRGGDGGWPMPGWTSAYGWIGWIPFDRMPYVFDPPKGYIVTANQAVIESSFPYKLADTWSYGYRSDRISDVLDSLTSSGRKVSPDDVAQLQLDTTNGLAKVLVPYLLRVRVSDFTSDGQDLLRRWDFSQPPDSQAAAYFNAVWKNLLASTFHDELPESTWPGGRDRWYEIVRKMLAEPRNVWWDNVKTRGVREDRDAILVQALTDARDELTMVMAKSPTRWRWGKLHQLTLKNQTFGSSGIAPLEKLFNRGPYELGGGSDAVNATGWEANKEGLPSYQVSTVPSMRMVVDLANLDQSRWINLTGASGHPTSPNYNDQAPLWVAGRTIQWPFTQRAIHEVAHSTLTLAP
jgi:penicillin amidase